MNEEEDDVGVKEIDETTKKMLEATEAYRDMYLALEEKDGVNMNNLEIKEDNTGWLGPYITKKKAETARLDRYPLGGGTPLYKTSLEPSPFFELNRRKKLVGSWPMETTFFIEWYERLYADSVTKDLWEKAGISRLLALCTKIPKPDHQLFKAALCFWSTGSNGFVFPLGAMTITLLDVVALTGLSVAEPNEPPSSDHHTPISSITFQALENQFWPNETPKVSKAPVTEAERHGFIHYWLYKFIICPTTAGPRQGLSELSLHIASGCFDSDIAEIVLGHLYHGMHTLVKQLRKGKTLNGSGPLWLVSLWLWAYFPSFCKSLPSLEEMKSKPASYGLYYSMTDPLDKKFDHYFSAFYHMDTLSCFTPFKDRLLGPPSFTTTFEEKPPKESESHAAYELFANQWSSWILARDIIVSKNSNSTYVEVYNPHYVARQFGLTQAWPLTLPYSPQFGSPSERTTLTQEEVDKLDMWHQVLFAKVEFKVFTPSQSDNNTTSSFTELLPLRLKQIELFDGDAITIAKSLVDNTPKSSTTSAVKKRAASSKQVQSKTKSSKRPRSQLSKKGLALEDEMITTVEDSNGGTFGTTESNYEDNEPLCMGGNKRTETVVLSAEVESPSIHLKTSEASETTVVVESTPNLAVEVSPNPCPTTQLGFNHLAAKLLTTHFQIPSTNLFSINQTSETPPNHLRTSKTLETTSQTTFSQVSSTNLLSSEQLATTSESTLVGNSAEEHDMQPQDQQVTLLLDGHSTVLQTSQGGKEGLEANQSTLVASTCSSAMDTLDQGLKFLEDLESKGSSNVVTPSIESTKSALAEVGNFLSLSPEEAIATPIPNWPISALGVLSHLCVLKPLPGMDTGKMCSLRNASYYVEVWLASIKRAIELRDQVNEHEKTRAARSQDLSEKVARCKELSKDVISFRQREMVRSKEITRLEGRLSFLRQEDAQDKAINANLAQAFKGLTEEARLLKEQVDSLKSVEQVANEKEDAEILYQTTKSSLAKLKATVEEALHHLKH